MVATLHFVQNHLKPLHVFRLAITRFGTMSFFYQKPYSVSQIIRLFYVTSAVKCLRLNFFLTPLTVNLLSKNHFRYYSWLLFVRLYSCFQVDIDRRVFYRF